jgi:ATP-dependent protease ClpP protease subunit
MTPFNLSIPESVKAAISDKEFRAYAVEGDTLELLLYGEIGDGLEGAELTAQGVTAFLRRNPGQDIEVRINSPGGLVYDGMQMFNALKAHTGNVTVTIEALAYSAAAFVAMAGDRVRMHEASDFGIHRSWGVAVGNLKVMQATMDWLGRIDEHQVDIFTEKTGESRDQITAWLDGIDDGTVFTAQEAVQAGFADEIIPMGSGTSKKKRKTASADARPHLAALRAKQAKHAAQRKSLATGRHRP